MTTQDTNDTSFDRSATRSFVVATSPELVARPDLMIKLSSGRTVFVQVKPRPQKPPKSWVKGEPKWLPPQKIAAPKGENPSTFFRNIINVVASFSEIAREPAPAWIEHIYSYVSASRNREAIDILFSELDDLITKGEMKKCNWLLQVFDLRRLNTTLLLGLLAITRRAASRLPERQKVVARVEAILRTSEPDRAERLLAGIR